MKNTRWNIGAGCSRSPAPLRCAMPFAVRRCSARPALLEVPWEVQAGKQAGRARGRVFFLRVKQPARPCRSSTKRPRPSGNFQSTLSKERPPTLRGGETPNKATRMPSTCDSLMAGRFFFGVLVLVGACQSGTVWAGLCLIHHQGRGLARGGAGQDEGRRTEPDAPRRSPAGLVASMARR